MTAPIALQQPISIAEIYLQHQHSAGTNRPHRVRAYVQHTLKVQEHYPTLHSVWKARNWTRHEFTCTHILILWTCWLHPNWTTDQHLFWSGIFSYNDHTIISPPQTMPYILRIYLLTSSPFARAASFDDWPLITIQHPASFVRKLSTMFIGTYDPYMQAIRAQLLPMLPTRQAVCSTWARNLLWRLPDPILKTTFQTPFSSQVHTPQVRHNHLTITWQQQHHVVDLWP